MKDLLLLIMLSCICLVINAQDVITNDVGELQPIKKWSHRIDFTVLDVQKDDWRSEEDLIGGIVAEYSASYTFSRWLSTGLGMGYQRINTLDQGMIPFFVDFSGYLLDRTVTPLYRVKLGKVFINDEEGGQWRASIDNHDGYMVHPQVGLQITKHAQFSIGYRMLFYKQHIDYGENNFSDRTVQSKRWSLAYSILF